MKYTVTFIGIFWMALNLRAQEPIPVRKTAQLPEAATMLALPDGELRGQVIETEMVMDLVQAWMADSVLDARRQRLAGFGGWMAQRLGSRYWEYLDPVKRKYIGSMSRPFKMYDGMGDEYDINVFLMPHLPEYVEMVRAGFLVALERPRNENHFRFDNPPDFPCPKELEYKDKGFLTVECEGTPNKLYRDRLDKVFLPMGKGAHDLEQWPLVGTKYPSFGMYGAWCMDCNHNCRVEVHPFDWLWWLDMSEDRPGSPRAKSWMIGVFKDGSRRFEDWSPAPMSGVISIPMVFPKSATHATVKLEHLLFDDFHPENLEAMGLPSGTMAATPGTQQFVLTGTSLVAVELQVEGDDPGKGMVMWWSEFEEETDSGQRMGYLNLGMSVETTYAARLTVDYR